MGFHSQNGARRSLRPGLHRASYGVFPGAGFVYESAREHPTDIPIIIRRCYSSVEFQEGAMKLLYYYDWPGNVRELILMVGRLAAKASGRIITTDLVRSETDAEQSPALAPSNTERFPRLREDETLTDYL